MCERPVFLLGAGFNADANTQAERSYGESIFLGRHEIKRAYPLVSDLAGACFDLPAPPIDLSIEDLFQKAIDAKDPEPIRRLVNAVFKADYYIASQLAQSRAKSSYSKFFDRFTRSHFLTFNYDSLADCFLFARKRWFPHDGYGVPVDVRNGIGRDHQHEHSLSLVLHLHGSPCVYPSTFTLDPAPAPGEGMHRCRPLDKPKYLFDPDSTGDLFHPFKSATMAPAYVPPEDRVIAPVPEKAAGLRRDFVANVYQRAAELLAEAGPVVVIGYSFNPFDQASYDPLLRAIARRPDPLVRLVCPEASTLRRRMAKEYPSIAWEALPRTFAGWVEQDMAATAP